ncbi:hypothetical protein V6Z11_A13G246500 [Gossypium hirsutum]
MGNLFLYSFLYMCDQSRSRYLLYKKAVSYVATEIFSTIQRKIHPTSSFGAG